MRKLTVVVAAVMVAVVSVWVSSGAAVTSNPVVAVQVDAFSVFPATQGAPKGKVKFIVTNTGTFKHEFVVLKTTKPAGNLLKGKEADEAGNVGEIGGIPAGQAKTLTLTLGKGHFALICNLPGSAGGAVECLEAALPAIPHALDLLSGGRPH